MDYIFEFNNSLTTILCENIIELFEEDCNNETKFNIPKNNENWKKIENILYKEILIKINNIKNKIILDINKNIDFIDLLNKSLYTKDLCIQKINSEEDIINKYNFIPNRYNVFTYIFYLNDIEGGEIVFTKFNSKNIINNSLNNEIIINPKKGKLIIFIEDINNYYYYKYNIPKESQYIISGQIFYSESLH